MNDSQGRGGDDDFGTVGDEPTIAAKYAGNCAACGMRFAVGDPIATVVVDKRKTYHHRACRYPASALLAEQSPAPTATAAPTPRSTPCSNAPQKGERYCGPHLTKLVAGAEPAGAAASGPDPYDEPF